MFKRYFPQLGAGQGCFADAAIPIDSNADAHTAGFSLNNIVGNAEHFQDLTQEGKKVLIRQGQNIWEARDEKCKAFNYSNLVR